MRSFALGQRSKLTLGVVLRPPGQVRFLASSETGSFPGLVRQSYMGASGRESRSGCWESGQSGPECLEEPFRARVASEPICPTTSFSSPPALPWAKFIGVVWALNEDKIWSLPSRIL